MIMNYKQLSDSIYLIPVLLDHFKKPTKLTATVLSKVFELSEKDIQEFRKAEKLLQYHYQFIQGGDNYPLLRQGLAQYFDLYLRKIFQKIELTNNKWSVLDYGCGSGQIGLRFKEDNPESKVYSLDKVNPIPLKDYGSSSFICVDFEKAPLWYKQYPEAFDCVIMSELLHCKNLRWQLYLVNSAHKILKPKGMLIVIENIDYCMAYRIHKLKKTAANVITPLELQKLVLGKFRLKKHTNIHQHQIYVYEKI